MFQRGPGPGRLDERSPNPVSQTDTLIKSLLSTGFPYDVATVERNNIAQFIV
jgi:hypothetical protein